MKGIEPRKTKSRTGGFSYSGGSQARVTASAEQLLSRMPYLVYGKDCLIAGLDMITVALPKGGLLTDSIQLLKSIGLDFSALLDSSNRQLEIWDKSHVAKALLVRNNDVPVYVEYGQAQLGIVGYDILREKRPRVAHLLNLGFGECRLSVAVKATSAYKSALDLPPHCRVASKFTHCAHEYFNQLELPVEIVPLYGSVELGPITGMSEAIVDLVASGRTLKENNLIELEQILTSTARLIAHPLSYRLNQDNLQRYINQIRGTY